MSDLFVTPACPARQASFEKCSFTRVNSHFQNVASLDLEHSVTDFIDSLI